MSCRLDAHVFFFLLTYLRRRQQGYFWRELGRYNLDRDIKVTPNAEYPSRAFAQSEYNGKTYKMSVADNDKLLNLA